jgi:hypothetical protein
MMKQTWKKEAITDVINLMLGAWLFVTPWVFSFVPEAAASWSAWLNGLAVGAVAAIVAFAEWEEWINLVLGLWVAASAWIVGFSGHATATRVHVLVGTAVAVVSAVRLWFVYRSAPRRSRTDGVDVGSLAECPAPRAKAALKKSRFSPLGVVIWTSLVLSLWMDHAVGQEIILTPLETKEVAKGYRADALKLKTVVNDKNDIIGRIDDFIFGKDGNIYVVLSVGDITGLRGQFIAVPFRILKLDDPSGNIIVPGASRSALEKLPVLLSTR